MCYPECEDPYTIFLNAYGEFKSDLHRLLIFKQAMRTKYEKVYYNTDRGRDLMLYVQVGTDSIVKVSVNPMMDAKFYQQDPVDIYAEDAIMLALLQELDSVKVMQQSMAICREIVYEDQVLVKLKYGDMTGKPYKFK